LVGFLGVNDGATGIRKYARKLFVDIHFKFSVESWYQGYGVSYFA